MLSLLAKEGAGVVHTKRETRLILTVTPNATVDKTYRVEDFALNRVHRPQQTLTVAGGKGINVARVYRTLGGDALATGFLGGEQGRIVARELKREQISGDFVAVRGETRVCIAIVDPKSGTQTEVNERGPNVGADEVEALRERFSRLLSQHRFDFVVLSGSLPPDAPDALYAELIERARAANIPAVLDASGEALRQGIAARPWLVKPNQFELQALLARPIETDAEILTAARELQRSGIANVIASRGERGAVYVGASGAWSAVPPKIEFASAVASGDSFVAAFLWAWQFCENPEEPEFALRIATGAGAANAMVIGAGFCSRESIFEQAARSEIHRFSD